MSEYVSCPKCHQPIKIKKHHTFLKTVAGVIAGGALGIATGGTGIPIFMACGGILTGYVFNDTSDEYTCPACQHKFKLMKEGETVDIKEEDEQEEQEEQGDKDKEKNKARKRKKKSKETEE